VEGLRNEKDENDDDIPKDVLPREAPVGILVETVEKPFAEATIIAERVTDLFIDFMFAVVCCCCCCW
jgi:hypothetical protein